MNAAPGPVLAFRRPPDSKHDAGANPPAMLVDRWMRAFRAMNAEQRLRYLELAECGARENAIPIDIDGEGA